MSHCQDAKCGLGDYTGVDGENVANIVGPETPASPQRETFNRPELVLFRFLKSEHEAVSPASYLRGAVRLHWKGDPRHTSPS